MKYIVRDIERAVCLRFNLTPEQMRSPSRVRKISGPRLIAMYLAREFTAASYPQIGRHFGGRDHTTIMSGKRRVEQLLRQTNTMAGYIDDVRGILEALTPYKESVGAALCAGLGNPERRVARVEAA